MSFSGRKVSGALEKRASAPVGRDPGIAANRALIFPFNRVCRASPAQKPFVTPESSSLRSPGFIAYAIKRAGSPHVKAVANEETLLQNHCCSWRFLARANWETFVADTKCFWTKSETFLCPGHKICVRNKCCARGKTGKPFCRQQCVRNNVSSFAARLTDPAWLMYFWHALKGLGASPPVTRRPLSRALESHSMRSSQQLLTRILFSKGGIIEIFKYFHIIT